MSDDLKVTPEYKETFLELLLEIPNITAVCRLTGVSPSTIKKHRDRDPDWDAKIKEYRTLGYDSLEAEAYRRGVEGVLEPVYYQGDRVDVVRKYSDVLLRDLLKACLPRKYNPGVGINIGDGVQKIELSFNMWKGDKDAPREGSDE